MKQSQKNEVRLFILTLLREMDDLRWKLDGLDTTKIYTVFEQYCLIPRAKLVEFEGSKPTDEDWKEMICAQQILIPNSQTFTVKDPKESGGHVAFVAEVIDAPDEFPLEGACLS